jgi:hypothetical protein
MAFYDVSTMGGAGRRTRGAGNKRNPLNFGRGAGAYTTSTMGSENVEGCGIFSGLLGALGLGAEGLEDGGYAKGVKRSAQDIKNTSHLASMAKASIKARANALMKQGAPHKQAMAQARAEHKANKSKKKRVPISQAKNKKAISKLFPKGGYAVGGLDMGEKRFLREIDHSPAQMRLAENYGQFTGGKLGMVRKGGMMQHQMNMLPYDVEGSGIFSSLLGSLGLGVNEDNLRLLQQIEQKVEEQLPLESKGAGRMLVHHVMRHHFSEKSHKLKGAGWFDDIVSGFTKTIEKIIPLVPVILPIVKQFL